MIYFLKYSVKSLSDFCKLFAIFEISFTKPDSWGSILQMHTGSKNHNIFLCSVAKKQGLKLIRHRLFNRETDEKVAGETEEEIYEELGLDYKPPEQRNK
ncbi:hypothetical protein C9439_03060 [archaeon SCG-AAA382B04]|nr:hypothetical protein C9439_03060 [archaeon SCG-AAA382B04]